MPAAIETKDYRALADLRYRLRLFLHEGDAAARRVGLEPQQYLFLLAVRGLPAGVEATIRTLADRLALKHNSTVEMIDRLVTRGYVSRTRSRDDRRRVLVSLRPSGERILENVARRRITELRTEGAALANAIDAVLGRKHKSRTGKKQRVVKMKRRENNREQE